ncbi:hypothetical protein GALMADRAFT_144342 [Galerina marginata CBS 339.88]|uniref:Uncharacterized protein n=1 Tax=Galerina marginata (strain CBS 339.88) TaxID=685588 RepID=A0A067SVR2_GALM3|nr:hypothetical protein GALMADRAFT_144342 [Galerina marginata CBS 339.88]
MTTVRSAARALLLDPARLFSVSFSVLVKPPNVLLNDNQDTRSDKLGEDGSEVESPENGPKRPSEPARPLSTSPADDSSTHDDANIPSYLPSPPSSSAFSPPPPSNPGSIVKLSVPDTYSQVLGSPSPADRCFPSSTRPSSDPASTLLELHDPVQNISVGHYVNVLVDLSCMVFAPRPAPKEASGLAAVDGDGVIKVLKEHIERIYRKTALKLVQDLGQSVKKQPLQPPNVPAFPPVFFDTAFAQRHGTRARSTPLTLFCLPCHVDIEILIHVRGYVVQIYDCFIQVFYQVFRVVSAIITISKNVIHVVYSLHDQDCSLAYSQRQFPLLSLLIAATANGTRSTTTTSIGTPPLKIPPFLVFPLSPTLLVPSMSLTKRFAGRVLASGLVCGFLSSITTGVSSSNHVVGWKSKLATQNHIRPPQARFLPRPSLLIPPHQMQLPTRRMLVLIPPWPTPEASGPQFVTAARPAAELEQEQESGG